MSTPPLVKKPTIKILLYTDDPRITDTNNFGEFLGLGSMLQRMLAHAPIFATLPPPKFVNRNPDKGSHAKFRIDQVLEQEVKETGEPFDEIWFFGLHQANLEKFSLQTFLGGPNSELSEQEINALADWMKIKADGSGGGGVLITGDHSDELMKKRAPASFERCSGNSAQAEFLGLGRAIGRCVPRAGQLRTWEGAPTRREKDRFSTIFNFGRETDQRPQPLDLPPVNAAGDPDRNGQPHPLFLYKPGQFIRVFPDHGHEGAVVLPTEEQFKDTKMWPIGKNGQTRPSVVACGTNTLTRQPLNIVATYNGDLCEVGRIVADSTWHHYFNLNLKGFPHPAQEGTDSDQIGQFYANLAIWLAPRHKRIQMARAMAWQIADYMWVLERYQEASRAGRTAEAILSKVASPCEIHEMYQVLRLDQPDDVQRLTIEAADLLPSTSMILGSVIESYHEAAMRTATNDEELGPTAVEDAINRGYRRALDARANELQRTVKILNARTQIETRKATVMECDAEKTWHIDTLVNKPNEQPVTLSFCIDINADNGKITGEVFQGDERLSDVSGTNERLGSQQSMMMLNFAWPPTNILMIGLAIGDRPAKFVGGFVAFGTGEAVRALVAPGDGDTGTATGSQT